MNAFIMQLSASSYYPTTVRSTLFSNIFNVRSFLNLTNFHTHTKQQLNWCLYTSIFTFLAADEKTNDSELHVCKYTMNLICLNFSKDAIFL
jgi:hypothetical protein